MTRGMNIMWLNATDTDALLFKSLLAVILLTALWPLGFLAYLVTVYGARILLW